MRGRWLAWRASLRDDRSRRSVGRALRSQTRFTFASAEEGRAVLGARDGFVERLSAFDRSARLHTDRETTIEQFCDHARMSVQEWTGPERRRVAAAWKILRPRLEPLALPLPPEILLISTSGAEEGNAPYTRGPAIVLAPADRAKAPAQLAELLAHELFHVLSRHAPALRDRLYACIGFLPCGELDFPAALRERRITNPDAPELRHVIRVVIGERTVAAMPVLFATSEHYDPERGGEFFDYLQARLLAVEPAPPGGRTRPVSPEGRPELLEFDAVPDFFAQVGRNTNYIIHPEEILADNFRFLVFDTGNLPSPEIVERMRGVLRAN